MNFEEVLRICRKDAGGVPTDQLAVDLSMMGIALIACGRHDDAIRH